MEFPHPDFVEVPAPEKIMDATSGDLDRLCRRGCQDPDCKHRPEEHYAMGIEPRCHATNRVAALYDSRHKTIELSCGVCGAHVMRLKLEEEPARNTHRDSKR